MKIKSMRGKPVDFAYYMEMNADQPALGNAMLNARGDQLDRLGNVVKTRADMASDYHRSEKSVKQVSIKTLDAELFQSPVEAIEALKRNEKSKAKAAEDKFGGGGIAPATSTSKRKLSDSE